MRWGCRPMVCHRACRCGVCGICGFEGAGRDFDHACIAPSLPPCDTFAMSPSSSRPSSGFTLIEIMLLVVLVAILAAIAYPSYSNYVLRSKLRVAQTDLAALGAHLENLRQRTLWYPVADAEAGTVVTGWQPSADADD